MLIPHYYAQDYAGIMWTTLKVGRISSTFLLCACVLPRKVGSQNGWKTRLNESQEFDTISVNSVPASNNYFQTVITSVFSCALAYKITKT